MISNMLSKQKLLQWIDGKLAIFERSDSDGEKEALLFLGRRRMLYTLQRDIDSGWFDTDEEEPGPRFRMDANGNLTPIE